MNEFGGMRDLADALDELASRERAGERNFPMCCLLLYAGGFGPDLVVHEYIHAAYEYLDELTGDDVLVFVSHLSGDGSAAIAVAKHLKIPLDSMPSAVFFVPGADRTRLVLRIRDIVGNDIERVDLLMKVVTQAARECLASPPAERLNAFSLLLNEKLAGAFPAVRALAAPANRASKVSAGAGVVAAIAAAVKLFTGG